MQFSQVRRRELITLFSGAATAWSFGAQAQQPERVRRVVVLMGAAETAWSRGWLAAFLHRLDELGWRESRKPGHAGAMVEQSAAADTGLGHRTYRAFT